MRVLFALFTVLIMFAIVGCDSMYDKPAEADRLQAKATEIAMAEANRQVGMPDITNFTERKLARDILELRDQATLSTYTYIVNWQGEKIFLGNSIGYGLPYSVQFTSPVYHLDEPEGGDLAMPQPDPNGLFMPDGLSATWILLVNPTTGKAEPVYVESEILVSPFKLH